MPRLQVRHRRECQNGIRFLASARRRLVQGDVAGFS
jgi:hypothetical protein